MRANGEKAADEFHPPTQEEENSNRRPFVATLLRLANWEDRCLLTSMQLVPERLQAEKRNFGLS